MKKIIFLTSLIILFYIGESCAQKKIQIRPSLGWAKGYNAQYKVITNTNSQDNWLENKTKYVYNRERYTDRLFDFQIGLMLEYEINKHHTLGIGFMTGGTESNFTTHLKDTITRLLYYTSGSRGRYIKQGIEYTFTQNIGDFIKSKNNFLNKISISLLFGAFITNNASGYDNDFITLVKDNHNNTVDSLLSPATVINDRGWMISGGLRFSYLNKKHKEKISISLLYDHGLSEMVLFEHKTYFNYLNNYIIGQQLSKGSQLKLYISFPINLYDFKKDKFNLFR